MIYCICTVITVSGQVRLARDRDRPGQPARRGRAAPLLCYIMIYSTIILCYDMLYDATIGYTILYYTMLCYVMLYHVTHIT